MAWVAVNEDGSEIIVNDNRYLERDEDLGEWTNYGYYDIIQLPYGSIEMLLGKEITWEDEPMELSSCL